MWVKIELQRRLSVTADRSVTIVVIKNWNNENLKPDKHINTSKNFCADACSGCLYIGVTQPGLNKELLPGQKKVA